MAFFKDDLKKIRAFVFDVDGVLSRQTQNIDPGGELIRTSCTKDGYAIMYGIRKGYVVAIISGGGSPGMRERFEKLGIRPEDIYLKAADKLVPLEEIRARYALAWEEMMYMGDDLPDYSAMARVGLAVCPRDACEEVKSVSRYVSEQAGGEGCARDVIAQVLKAKGDWLDLGCHVRSM